MRQLGKKQGRRGPPHWIRGFDVLLEFRGAAEKVSEVDGKAAQGEGSNGCAGLWREPAHPDGEITDVWTGGQVGQLVVDVGEEMVDVLPVFAVPVGKMALAGGDDHSAEDGLDPGGYFELGFVLRSDRA